MSVTRLLEFWANGFASTKSLETSNGSETTPLISSFRFILKSSASICGVFGVLILSGCTPSAGPDIGVATYGITPSPLSIAGAAPELATTGPDQNLAASVGASSVAQPGLSASLNNQAFAPGSVPPSAVLPVALASSTSLNVASGPVANSGDYVTDGVVKTVGVAAKGPAPLVPADLAGQVPMPVLASVSPATNTAAAKPAQQVASLDVGKSAAPVVPTSISDPVVTQKSARPTAKQKPTLFGNLFGGKPKAAEENLTPGIAAVETVATETPVQVASLQTTTESSGQQTEVMSSLPGVKTKNLFALDPVLNSGDEPFDDQPEVQLASASAAGLARLAPNGILKQTDRVDVACFKPQLVAVLKSVERHYGKKVVVTSGYRSSTGNRRAGGSRNSLHISCAAADIQIAGVGKWQLAKYLRTMPGRGGVGTYCHTDSVHIDIGSERDWNWRCRRR